MEKSICNDAPGDIWFVIVGFAIVSVGLFIVAVSFRLLLQQKEVRVPRLPRTPPAASFYLSVEKKRPSSCLALTHLAAVMMFGVV